MHSLSGLDFAKRQNYLPDDSFSIVQACQGMDAGQAEFNVLLNKRDDRCSY